MRPFAALFVIAMEFHQRNYTVWELVRSFHVHDYFKYRNIVASFSRAILFEFSITYNLIKCESRDVLNIDKLI